MLDFLKITAMGLDTDDGDLDFIHSAAAPALDRKGVDVLGARFLWMAAVWVGVLALAGEADAQARMQQSENQAERASFQFGGEIELSRLIELATERLGVSIQYADDRELSQRVTLRLRQPMTDEELWSATLATLESHGLTVVETRRDGLYRVESLQKAAAQGQGLVLPGETMEPGLGAFASVLVRLKSADASRLASSLSPLTPTGGAVKPIGESGLVLITGPRARVERLLELARMLDAPAEPMARFMIELESVTASEAATLVHQVLTAVEGEEPSAAKLIPLPDGRRLMVVAPARQKDNLRALIEQFDAAPAVTTRGYSAPSVDVEELAEAIDRLLTTGSAPGRAAEARAAADPLTGSVLVTASAREHEKVESFVARLRKAPPTPRRLMRAFVIENRDAEALRDILEELLSQRAAIASNERPAASEQTGRASSEEQSQAVPDGGDPTEESAEVGAQPETPQSLATGASQPERAELSLTVDAATNTIIAAGAPRRLDQLKTLIERLDKRQPQVMLEATLVTLSEGEALDVGVELRAQFEAGETSVDLSSLFGLSAEGGSGFTGAAVRPSDYEALARAVESVSGGRTLSAPTILVNNNATGALRAVNQQPFTSINASDTVATTSFGGTQDAGTTITVTPRIAEGDHLVLEYAVELSAFTGESTTTADGGVIPPPTQTNTVEGSVTIPDGYTVVVGGLDDFSDNHSQTRVPLLGRIPGLGLLFSSRSDSYTSDRFFVFLRGTILRDAGFEDLKRLSAPEGTRAGIESGFPELDPVWIE